MNNLLEVFLISSGIYFWISIIPFGKISEIDSGHGHKPRNLDKDNPPCGTGVGTPKFKGCKCE